MAASYDPMEVERDWYAWWEKNRMFESDAVDPSKPQFTMVIPPPNVTGSLHIGHALTNTLQDALVRWRRMHGDQVTWVPGLDHAGIATQTVVEKHLAKTQPGTTRHTLGRERFVGEVWKWVDQYGGRINHQLRQLGLSLAWSRAAFTLDAPRSAAVTEAFVRLHRDGLVFRAARVVHWCTHLRTAISDIEVEFVEVTKRTKHKLPGGQRSVDIGVMHRLKYDVVDANGAVCGTVLVDTTRPETILADQVCAMLSVDCRTRFMYYELFDVCFNRQLPYTPRIRAIWHFTASAWRIR
jgi:valyl-tRNA synthetase